jgi:amino acid transporter
MLNKIKNLFFGAPRNPFNKETRNHISLIAFLAWVGLGADGLSSSAYGPEQAFLALGTHTYIALYLAIATALTVFIIALAYNQVIELFPSGGGGYKVASRLLSPFAGLISGSALVLNYTLTIAISFASGVDALFSLLPYGLQAYKLHTAIGMVLLLTYLNLRGMKESIKIFLPIFLGFVATHFIIILYGIVHHSAKISTVVHNTWAETMDMTNAVGWFFVVAVLIRAYSLGGGTYTGLEAVSNNVNNLAEPRVQTGKWTMLYMAISLSITAGGIILLYLLWNAKPIAGQTLNAVTFGAILHNVAHGYIFLLLLLIFEAGLLFVGANTGFLGGPAVLASMAIDEWAPRRFRNLSSRLVVQNGIILFGILAIIILIWTGGTVSQLVVLYSMNVFITFTLSLSGLCIFWWQRRAQEKKWLRRFALSTIGLTLCAAILIVTVVEKFASGGWLTILLTSVVVALGLMVKRHYKKVRRQITALDKIFALPVQPSAQAETNIDPNKPTAVFFIGGSIGEGMHTVIQAQKMFAGMFKNFIFLSAGVVDVNTYESDKTLYAMQTKVNQRLQYFSAYANQHGIAVQTKCAFGTEPVAQLVALATEVNKEIKNPIFFAAKLVLANENWLTRWLHNETPNSLQKNLHLLGMQMIILPITLGEDVVAQYRLR